MAGGTHHEDVGHAIVVSIGSCQSRKKFSILHRFVASEADHFVFIFCCFNSSKLELMRHSFCKCNFLYSLCWKFGSQFVSARHRHWLTCC